LTHQFAYAIFDSMIITEQRRMTKYFAKKEPREYTMTKLSDIAKLTGVHVTTVSKALNGSDEISVAKREEIVQTARTLGYLLPDQRAPKKLNDVLTVAVIYPDMTSSYYSRILVAIEEKVSCYNGYMVTACSRFDADNEVHLADRFANMPNVDGLIVISGSQNLTRLLGKVGALMPVVVITHSDIDNKIDLIRVNDRDGINEAIDYFAKMGHRNIGFIGERFTILRLGYFKEALLKHGLLVNEDFIKVSSYRFEEAGYDNMSKLLKQGKLPTAIYAAYDNIAIGAMKAIYEAGLKIPDDISIIGEDDLDIGDYQKDRLSTIDCHVEEQGDIACSILYKKIMDRSFNAMQNVVIRTELIIRDSVAAPASAETLLKKVQSVS
jgi:DNA-binding LacI/PurR family transcriptional regulator